MPKQSLENIAGRIAFRVEGHMWNAYWAMPDTMEGALWLGSIHRRMVETPELRQSFIELMRTAVTHVVPDFADADWRTEPAPESDRTKE